MVVVAGGGPAGLLSSSYLASSGCEATLYEEHRRVGVPKHCTGLVSLDTLELLPLAVRRCVRTSYRGVRVVTPGGLEAVLEVRGLVRLERPCLEEVLLERAVEMGVRVVTDVRLDLLARGRYLVPRWWKRGNVFVVDARGFEGLRERRAKASKRAVPGVNVTVSPGLRLDESLAHVYVDGTVARGFFLWALDNGDGTALVGGASEDGLSPENLLGYFRRLGVFKGDPRVIEVFGGMVIRGPPLHSFFGGNWLGVGDAVAMNKPLTGGGIFPLALLSSVLRPRSGCAEAIAELARAVRETIETLSRQYPLSLVAKTPGFAVLSAVAVRLLREVSGRRGADLVFDYDRHERNLVIAARSLLGIQARVPRLTDHPSSSSARRHLG